MPRPNTRGEYPDNWPEIAHQVKEEAGWCCIRCDHPHDPTGGYGLTVHHMDGDKSLCVWWNLMALCQRCHLSFQARVDPEQPYFLEHSEWAKPHIAGFYAWKYLKELQAREEVMENLNYLLSLEGGHGSE